MNEENVTSQVLAICTWLQGLPGWEPRLQNYARVFALACAGTPCPVPGGVPRAVAALISLAPELRAISISETVQYTGDYAVRVHFSISGQETLPCWQDHEFV